MTRMSSICIFSLLIASVCSLPAQEKTEDKTTYDDHVLPILRQRCMKCHNTNKKEGDLDLSTFTNTMLGGGSGPVIEGGDANGSYLFKLVTHEEEPTMPPETKIPDNEIAIIKAWIDKGVLENKSSVAKLKPKTKFEFALTDSSAGRPENPAMPAKLLQETLIETPRPTATTAIATSPWAPLIALAGHKQVLLYHSTTSELLGILPYAEGQPNVLKFSRNGSLLLVAGGRGGAAGKAVLFDVRSGRRVAEVGDELDAILAADVSPDQTMVAVGGPERLVRVYSTQTNEKLFEIKKHTDWITSLEFSPDGVLLASGDRNGGMFVWEAATGREYLVLKGHTKMITGISWRLDSNLVSSSSEDTNIRLWELENGKTVKNWGAHGTGTSSVEFARDGRLVTSGRDKVVKVWDQTGKQLAVSPAFADITVRASICDETNRVIVGDWTGKVQVHNAVDGKVLSELQQNPPKLAVRIASVQQTLQQVTAANATSAKAAADTLVAATTAKTNLANSQKSFADNTAKQKQLMPIQVVLNAEIPKLTQQLQGITTLKQKLDTAIPLLRASKENADKALATLGDEGTKAVAASIAKSLQQREAESQKAQNDLVALNTTLTAKKVELEKTNKELTAATQALAVAKQQVDTITPTIPALDKKVAETKQAADAAAAQLQAMTTKFNNLTAAKVFADAYQQLEAQLAAATKIHEEKFVLWQEKLLVVADSKKMLAQKQTALDAAKVALTAAQMDQTAKTTAFTAAQKAKTDVVALYTTLEKELVDQQKLITMFNEVVTKLQAISTGAPADQEMLAQLNSSKALLEKRKLRVAQLPALIDTEKKRIPQLDAAIATAQTNLDASKANVVKTQTAVTDATNQHATATKSVTESEQVAKAAQVINDQEAAKVDAIKKQIATLQGL